MNEFFNNQIISELRTLINKRKLCQNELLDMNIKIKKKFLIQ